MNRAREIEVAVRTLGDETPSGRVLSVGRRPLAAAVSAYCWPTIVAADRAHPQLEAIAAANLLLGWTGIGWLVALAWARSGKRSAT